MKRIDNSGFTIVELLIATVVFSVVLTIFVTTIVYVSDTLVKGSIQSQTQEIARSLEQNISQSIQASSGNITNNVDGSYYYYCIGNNRYEYTLNTEQTSTTNPILSVTSYSNCTQKTGLQSTQSLLGDNMRLGHFSITPLTSNPDLYDIEITIGYGDNSQLTTNDTADPYNYSCPSSILDGYFCDVTKISSIVQQRVQ